MVFVKFCLGPGHDCQTASDAQMLRCLMLRQAGCLLLRQDRCLLLRQDKSLLLQGQTTVLSQCTIFKAQKSQLCKSQIGGLTQINENDPKWVQNGRQVLRIGPQASPGHFLASGTGPAAQNRQNRPQTGNFLTLVADLGRGTGPKGEKMAAACSGLDSQVLATILDPFRSIFVD